ncbi:EGF-like domain-containing protein [Tieghemostelium lacteum]|uniref:EGF-like domain-containing protein n=1 Tax=Tieghemostelium lacteum TaxID=361077 RepID=A0A151ZC87_TIELA|nr:EGF-like domain-containing protein [Tieghemostelium lacteum]|eukprot:KYQ91562.1 EGF-like domain-containing protein [Tieghemostelium lacteum]
MKILLFCLLLFLYCSDGYQIQLLNPDSVNSYPDTLTYSTQKCSITYRFSISEDNGDADMLNFDIDAIPIPTVGNLIVMSSPYLESSNKLVTVTLNPNFGEQGSFYINMSNGATEVFRSNTIKYQCQPMPLPVTILNNNYKNWENSGQDGYYQTYLKLNLDKYADLENLAILVGNIYTCKFEQFGFDILKLTCTIAYDTAFTGPFGDLSIKILDSVNPDTSTQLSIGTFINYTPIIPIFQSSTMVNSLSNLAYRDIYMKIPIDNNQDRYFTPVINIQKPYLVKVVAGNSNSKTMLLYHKTISYGALDNFEMAINYFVNSTFVYNSLYTYSPSDLLVEPMTLTATNPTNLYNLYLLQMLSSGQLYNYEVSLSYGNYKKTILVSYPDGMKSKLNNGIMEAGFYAYAPPYKNSVNLGFKVTGLGKTFYTNYQPPTFTLNDIIAPSIEGIEFINIGYQQIIIRIHATDDYSGVYSIVFDGFAQLFPSDLASGNKLDGIYEKFVDFRNKSSYFTSSIYDQLAIVYDMAGNSASISPNIIPPIQNYPMTINSKYEQSVIQLDRVYFSISGVIDVTGIECPNTLFINFTNAHHDEIIRIEFYSIDVTTFGIWDNQYQMYKADFIIPKNLFTGTIPYYVYYRTVKFDSLMFPSTGQLKITSDNADRMPPMITNIDNTIAGGSQIGWTLTIEDGPNGFSHGLIKVTSDLDIGNPYIIELTGIPDSITQTIQAPLIVSPQCLTQIFTITYIELFDSAGVKSTYNDLSFIKSASVSEPPVFKDISPFISIINSATLSLSIQILSSLTCTADTLPPYIPNIVTYNSVDTSHYNRSHTLIFTARDTANTNALSRRIKPKMYLHSIFFETVSTQCEPTTFGANDIYISYTCTFQSIPYGFGQGYPVQWTASGFADVMLNFGYQGTTNLTSPFVFSRNYSVIETVSVPSSSGKLTISGKNLGTIENVEITFSNGETQIVPVIEGYNTVIIIEVPMDKNISSIKTVELPSNNAPMPDEYEFVPAPTCPGTPQCSGPDHGSCTISGCICIGNWGGNDCSLSGVNTPPIIINTTNPDIDNNFNTTLPDGQTVSLRTLLSVISLNELNKNGDDFKIHKFSQWIFSNTTSQSDLKGINEYTYESNITNNNLTTNVKVIIQYFQQKETIFFANQFLDMLPSSIKYKIEISPYSFDSNLNTLKLVMSASIESFDNSECSDGSSSTNSNLEEQEDQNSLYVRLNLNSHVLHGRLIKKGIIDNRIQTISNSVSQDNNLPSGSVGSTIGIHIPNFKKSVLLDPDFSVLLDTSATPSPNNNKNNCEASSKSSKLTKSQLAGIIVGSVGFALVVTISTTYYFYKRHSDKKSLAQINKKIATLN